MAYNKIVVNGEVKINLENDTVDSSHLVAGYTAHDASGEIIVGELVERGVSDLNILDGERIEIPPGYYPEKLTIWLNANRNFQWDPFTFPTDYISPDESVRDVESD